MREYSSWKINLRGKREHYLFIYFCRSSSNGDVYAPFVLHTMVQLLFHAAAQKQKCDEYDSCDEVVVIHRGAPAPAPWQAVRQKKKEGLGVFDSCRER